MPICFLILACILVFHYVGNQATLFGTHLAYDSGPMSDYATAVCQHSCHVLWSCHLLSYLCDILDADGLSSVEAANQVVVLNPFF